MFLKVDQNDRLARDKIFPNGSKYSAPWILN